MSLLENLLETAVATSEMSESDILFLFGKGERKTYAPGEYLFHEATPRLWAGIIEDGRVELVREGQEGASTLLSVLSKGALIAEGAIMSDSSHDVSAFTRKGVTVWQVPREIWQTAKESFPDIYYRHVARLAMRLRYASEQLVLARELLASNYDLLLQEKWVSKEALEYILKPENPPQSTTVRK